MHHQMVAPAGFRESTDAKCSDGRASGAVPAFHWGKTQQCSGGRDGTGAAGNQQGIPKTYIEPCVRGWEEVVRVSSSGTSLLLEYLEALRGGDIGDSSLSAEIAADPGYLLFLDRQRRMVERTKGKDPSTITRDEFRRFLIGYSEGRAWDGHELFARFGKSLDAARDRLPEYRRLLDALGTIDVGRLKGDVLTRLPRGASIESTVYFLAEIHTNAYVHGSDIVVSFFPLRLAKQIVDARNVPLEPILRHELHHIGMRSCACVGDEQSVAGIAASLLGGLLSEGAATMFFTPPEFNPDQTSWHATARDMRVHYSDFESILRRVLQGEIDSDETFRVFFQRFHEPYQGLSYPAVYPLGVDICRTMAGFLGTERFVEMLRTPLEVPQAYNAARSQQEDTPGKPFKFSEEVVCALEDLRRLRP